MRNEKGKLVGIKEASTILFGEETKANQQKVRRLAKAGQIPFIKSGSRYYFSRIALSRCIDYPNGEYDKDCHKWEGLHDEGVQEIHAPEGRRIFD